VTPELIRRYKLFMSAVFLGAATCFLLPFLVLSIDERVGRGSGVELATGNADVSGRYVHASYEGQIEEGMDLAQLPSAVAFFALLIGAVGAWLPSRKGFWLGLAAALAGVLGLFWLRQALSGPSLLAQVELQSGYWLSTVGVVVTAALAGFILYRTSWTYLNR
jgi:hypothetical protein